MAKKAPEPKKTRKKSGRPSSYDPLVHPKLAFKLAILGCTDAEIAEQFGISAQNMVEWKHKFPEFCESIRAGGKPANAAVADALRQRALGFEWEEEVATKVKNDDGKGESVVITKVKRIVPPDTNAASLFLRNREPKQWRDKVEVEHSGTIETRAARIKKAREQAKGAANGDE